MKDLKKGQLVFVERVVWQDEDNEMSTMMENVPVIFDHMEKVTLNEQKFYHWLFRDAEGNVDCIQGTEENPNRPRTVEEVFGFIPLI